MKYIFCLFLMFASVGFAEQPSKHTCPRDFMTITVDNDTLSLREFGDKYVSYYKVDPISRKMVKILCETDRVIEKKHHHVHGSRANTHTGKFYYKCTVCGKVFSASGASDHVYYVGHNNFDRVYYR